MFPQFGATAESLSKASSLVFRIGSDAHLYDDPDDANIASLLDSKFDSEKTEALKRLLALIAQGFDVANLFPKVVKNVASQSLEVKKLVYLYLLHYAEKRPNEALLSINCFQKDLSDPNPLVRAWALRAMAGIRLHAISPIVLAAVTKCARDPSPYVRRCAAHALSKIYDLQQEEDFSTLEELVGVLLCDNSPGVVGAGAAAFNSICPNNLLLIARRFRKLCEVLPDVDEWGQLALIEVLLRYVVARHGFVKDSLLCLSNCAQSSTAELESTGKDSKDVCMETKKDSCFMEDNGYDSKIIAALLKCYIGRVEYLLQTSNGRAGSEFDCAVFASGSNHDVELLLQCTAPLLWSRNSAVVLAAAGVHWLMAKKEAVKRIVKPLLFLLRSAPPSQYVVLCNIQVFSKAIPSIFAPYFEDFYVCSTDSYQIKALKLEILSTIATISSIQSIFQEFEDYIKDPDQRLAADTVAVLGLCAQRLPTVADICLKALLALIQQESSASCLDSTGGEALVLAQAVMSIKGIIKQNPASFEKVVVQLARCLDTIKVPTARATIIWIVGEYSAVGHTISGIVTIVSRYLANCFPREKVEIKLQILNSITKVVLFAPEEELHVLRMVLKYILELAKYDLSYDVRDRARIIRKLIFCETESEIKEGLPYNADLVQEVAGHILGGRMTSSLDNPQNFRFYLPGSLSQVVFHAAPGYGPLPTPCSLNFDEPSLSSEFAKMPHPRSTDSDSSAMSNCDTPSGSSVEGNSTDDSEHISSPGPESIGPEEDEIDSDDDGLPLIHLSDATIDGDIKNGKSTNNNSHCAPQLLDLMPDRTLDSWLDEQPNMPESSSYKEKDTQLSSARISIRDIDVRVKPKTHMLLAPSNGSGLSVSYSFASEVSLLSSSLVSVDVSFENHSSEPLAKIWLEDEESGANLESSDQALGTFESSYTAIGVPQMVPMDKIESLEPSQRVQAVLQIPFQHHLLPRKMSIFCNGIKYSVKLWPDIGYFIKPLSIDVNAFTHQESRLPGMFEYYRSCTFAHHLKEMDSQIEDKYLLLCQSLASHVLSNANLFLVAINLPLSGEIGDASGLCLRFSGEILSSSLPCLVTLMVVEGKCAEALKVSVKVNCEETVFGLNLLNRIVAFLA